MNKSSPLLSLAAKQGMAIVHDGIRVGSGSTLKSLGLVKELLKLNINCIYNIKI